MTSGVRRVEALHSFTSPASYAVLLPGDTGNGGSGFVLDAMRLLQWAAAQPPAARPVVWVVTLGSQGLGLSDNVGQSDSHMVALTVSGVWGLARSARAEFGADFCKCIDLDPGLATSTSGGQIAEELFAALKHDHAAPCKNPRSFSGAKAPAAAVGCLGCDTHNPSSLAPCSFTCPNVGRLVTCPCGANLRRRQKAHQTWARTKQGYKCGPWGSTSETW